MAKYKQIQTYVRCRNEENFQHILRKYRRLLLQIGLSKADIDRWITSITWSVDHTGTVSIDSNQLSPKMMLEIGQCKVNIYSSIIIWTNQMNSYVKEPWIELFIIIKPENLKSTKSTKTTSKLERVFLKMMTMFSEIFQETGVYVTNEMQDGEAFIGLVGSRSEKLWEFDCAIIPTHHLLSYQHAPENFKSFRVPFGISYFKTTL